MNRFLLALTVTVAAVLGSPLLALAQGEDGVTPPAAEAPEDFRWKITLAYGLVVGLVIVFIVLAHRRNAGVQEELDFVERRLDQLEG